MRPVLLYKSLELKNRYNILCQNNGTYFRFIQNRIIILARSSSTERAGRGKGKGKSREHVLTVMEFK